MRRTTIVFAVVTFAMTANAAGALPPPVQAHVDKDLKDCDTHDAKFEKGFMTRRDINSDGKEDFILDYGHFICGGMRSTYCGSAGCSTTIFASTATGYNKVFDDNVQDIKFRTIKGRPAMVLGLHGSSCGKVGSAACGEVLYWNGSTFSAAH